MKSKYTYIQFSGPEEKIEELKKVLEKLQARFSKWLHEAKITEDKIELIYNINTPTVRWLEKEMAPLLENTSLPKQIYATYIRPGKLHPEAIDFLNVHKDALQKAPSDLSWISESDWPLVFYLAQYNFLTLEQENEALGFDLKSSQLVVRSWIASIRVEEAEGEKFLKTWLNE